MDDSTREQELFLERMEKNYVRLMAAVERLNAAEKRELSPPRTSDSPSQSQTDCPLCKRPLP